MWRPWHFHQLDNSRRDFLVILLRFVLRTVSAVARCLCKWHLYRPEDFEARALVFFPVFRARQTRQLINYSELATWRSFSSVVLETTSWQTQYFLYFLSRRTRQLFFCIDKISLLSHGPDLGAKNVARALLVLGRPNLYFSLYNLTLLEVTRHESHCRYHKVVAF